VQGLVFLWPTPYTYIHTLHRLASEIHYSSYTLLVEEGNLINDFTSIEMITNSAYETSVTNSLGIRTSRQVIGEGYAM
jgi:hypothetical protein